ncbi:MAG: T9SS C-terminal target domain-containing protein [Ignavibacteriae bacterium]|nr:T9SS C-terminal target domain-containing protein [Ignavibacteriota bacterium]MBW7843274.1 T9SS type A sorting domain-containing protein [Ignavibacterium sp.]MCO6447834.1 T9SS type A sorting domain-containing protein [Ignavibacterium album]
MQKEVTLFIFATALSRILIMKKIIYIIFLVISPEFTFGQTASDYFPMQTGYKWNYELTPLDSLNNRVDSLTFYGIDSFFVETTFNGRDAKILLTKTGALNTINYQPFIDSLFFSFSGSNGYEYFDPNLLSGLIGNLDSTLGVNFFSFFNSLEGWYSYYRFANPVNQEYTIFSKDTIIAINSINFPVRFQLIGKRLSDETINTEIGSFTCKKFLLERRLSYTQLIPIIVKLFGVEETIWLAPSNWKVRSYIPATHINLSLINGPVFTISGLETNIKDQITDVDDNYNQPLKFELYQNYPNPFNPSTIIKYSLMNSEFVSLKIFDILGSEVKILVNEIKPAGIHEVVFNAANNLASGIYFYELKISGQVNSRKMALIR